MLLDTNPLVYWFEGHPLAARFESVFEAIDTGRLYAIITPITLAETLTGPLRSGSESLAQRYQQALIHHPGFSFCQLDADIAMLAARLRAQHRLKLPDAFQLAVALSERCAAIVTHDRDFGDVAGISVIGLE